MKKLTKRQQSWLDKFDKYCDTYKKKLPAWTVYGILGRTVIGE